MINQYILCMMLSVTLASFSQILLKKSTVCRYNSVIKEYLNLYVIGGYGLLFISMLLTIYAYSGMDYKNGPVIEAFGNVIVLVLSFIFLLLLLVVNRCLLKTSNHRANERQNVCK